MGIAILVKIGTTYMIVTLPVAPKQLPVAEVVHTDPGLIYS